MTEKPEAGTVALCPCCSSTIPHHWPHGCISLLEAQVAALQEKLAKVHEAPVARETRSAGLGSRYV